MTAPKATSVLIVDDDPDILEVMGLVLQSAGFAVHVAEHGRQALDELRAGLSPGLILLDMMMPVMDGWTFREKQRQDPELASIPVVVLTGDSRASEKAASVDAAGYLNKPVDLSDLIATLERYCAGGSASAENPNPLNVRR